MTTNITFTFNETEEQQAQIIINAQDVHCKVSELQEYVRGCLKYGHKFTSADEVLEYMQKELFDIKTVYIN